ncbi:MAG: Sec-independent protein translocase protein TatC [Candidatus Binatia bacterium]|nr:MAG: Sec-independent protein translocase protein TatC [Candidatus Binatia bacterium]
MAASPDDVRMPLTAHLEELRWRLIKALVGIGAAFLLCYQFAELLFGFLTQPLYSASFLGGDNPGHSVNLIGTGVVEAFFTKLKVALIAGVFLSSPVTFYQLWRFVAPGLYPHEKRYALPFVFFASFFFVAGAAFCYQLVLPVGYRFFLDQYATIGVRPELRISEYLSFTARMLLAFGATFELPVMTFFLARAGVVTHRTMLGYWRYAVVGIFVSAAVLTPGPDVASQLLMATPLLVLYGASIGVAYVFARPRPAPRPDA